MRRKAEGRRDGWSAIGESVCGVLVGGLNFDVVTKDSGAKWFGKRHVRHGRLGNWA